MDDNLRFIKCFNKPIDATIIEIINQDKIPEDKYLFPDLNYRNGFNLFIKKRLA